MTLVTPPLEELEEEGERVRQRGNSLGSSADVRLLPQRLVADCRAYSCTADLLRALDGTDGGDVACIFASDHALVADMKAAMASRKILLSGRALRDAYVKKEIDTVDSNIAEAGADFKVFMETYKTINTKIVIIDRAPSSKIYCAKVLQWARVSLREGGFLVIRNYAFWLNNKHQNQMVVAANDFILKNQTSMVGFAFNGNGLPDVCLRLEALGASAGKAKS